MFEIWREAQATGWCEEDRIEAFRNAQSEAMTLGFSPAAPIFEILFAQCLQKKGHAEGALAALEAAVVQIDSTGYNVWEPEVYRSMGDLLLRLNSSASAKAEVSYRRAIERARSQEAKSWELRARQPASRDLWQSQGQRQDAYELLAPVYGWFTEGFMFCDLVGSTALSSRLDPEDLREVIRTYQACVATTIQQFDGFIARYVGDGVLIYFGWPEARETDAERAVRAGLAVAAAVSGTPVSGEPLQVRVGIATGLVVIGEPIGSGDSPPADRGRRDAEPRGSPAGPRWAGPGRDRRGDPPADRWPVRVPRPRHGRTQRSAGAGAGLAGPVRKPHARPVRGAAFRRHAAGRPRRGNGAAAPPLGAGEGRQRPGGADFRRAGRGQVPPRRGAGRADRRRTAHSAALFLLAAPSGQRTLSGDRANGASGRASRTRTSRRPGSPNCKRCSPPPRPGWKTWR